MTEVADPLHPESLPPGWTRRPLREVTTKIGSGATPRGGASVYVAEGPSLIRSQNVHDNRFEARGLVHLGEDAAVSLRGVTIERQDVLINITGDSILRCCVVPDEALPARVNQHVAILRASDEMHPLILQKQMVLPEMKSLMLGHSAGGTRKAITKGHLEKFLVVVPPLGEQQRLAVFLQALDDKIESNRRIIASCRALAGAHYARAGGDGLSAHCVGDVVTFHNRRRVPLSMQERAAMPGDVPYYGATGVVAHVAEALFDEKLVLVGEDGSVVRPDGSPFLQYVWGTAWVNNHAHVLTGVGMSTELVLLALERADVRPLVTGAAQPKLSMGNLKSLMVILPAAESLAQLEAEIAPLFDVLRQRCDEIERLIALRDALLPELLSGRLRVPEAATT